MNLLEEWQLRTITDCNKHLALAAIDARLDALDFVICWYYDADDEAETDKAIALEAELYQERKKVLGW
jgi:hypothetical protein